VLVPAIVLEIALRASRPCGDGEAFGDQDVNGVAEQASQPSGSHGCRYPCRSVAPGDYLAMPSPSAAQCGY